MSTGCHTSGGTFVTCERGLLRSPKDVVGPRGWSLYIEQTFQSVAIVVRWMGDATWHRNLAHLEQPRTKV